MLQEPVPPNAQPVFPISNPAFVIGWMPEIWPSGLVTVTLTVPNPWAGVVAVIVLLFTTFTLLAAEPPKLTVAPVMKLLPLIVTAVPPTVAPILGEIDVIVGAPA